MEIFLFFTMYRMALGYTQPPIQWARDTISLRVKQSELEADYSLPSSAKAKKK
jgi:hypothetical protein